MTIEDALSRLTAGLAEDERTARAAAEQDAEGPSWRVRKIRHEGMYVFGDHQIATTGGKFGMAENAQTEHIERHDPARALRQVEAVRKVIGEHSQSGGKCDKCRPDWDSPYRDVPWPCPTVRTLASIYAEDTTGTGRAV